MLFAVPFAPCLLPLAHCPLPTAQSFIFKCQMTASRSDADDPYAVFRFAAFRWFVVSLPAMAMAAQVQLVAVGWETYQLTKNPLSFGLLGITTMPPNVR